jgi:L-alanine-DL-glutamate epimerase-like enolase superfamily enzyme
MIFDQPLRTRLAGGPVAEASQLVEGRLRVPTGPGLGITLDSALRDEFIARDPA